MLNVLTPYWPSEIPRYGANISLEYWQNDFTKGTEVAMRYNGEYQPIFVENYQQALVCFSITKESFSSSSKRVSNSGIYRSA